MSGDRVSIADAAHLAQVPASTIRRWISEGRLSTPFERMGRRVSVAEVRDLYELMSARRRG